MKQFSYKPQLQKDDKPVFSGEVVIQLPRYAERMMLLKSINFKASGDGKVDFAGDQIDSLVRMIGIAEKHVLSVNVTRVEDGYEFKSIEDLEYDKDGSELINEIANVVISGVKMGKH